MHTIGHNSIAPTPDEPALFPIDIETVDIASRTFAGLGRDEIEFVRDQNVRSRSDTDPVGYLLHLVERQELFEATEKQRLAYRLGVCVGAATVQLRIDTLTAQGHNVPSPTDAFAAAGYHAGRRPHLRRDSHASSVRVVGENQDFKRYLLDEASVAHLNSELRKAWQDQFGLFDEPESASYASLGMRDTFALFSYLYPAAKQPSSNDLTAEAV